MSPEYREYAERTVHNCQTICDELRKTGNKIITGGTDTNIMMWDIKPYGVNAKTMMSLGNAWNIQFNGVTLPTDMNFKYEGQGGLRFGTNVITSRGYQEEDWREVGRFVNEMANIARAIEKPGVSVWEEVIALKGLSQNIEDFAYKFPLPGITSQHIF